MRILSRRRARVKNSRHSPPHAFASRSKVTVERISLTPDPDVIHPILLRKGRTGGRAADEIASHRAIEKDKELALELLRAVNSSRDVSLVILNPIYKPSDGRGCAGKGVCVEPGREGNG